MQPAKRKRVPRFTLQGLKQKCETLEKHVRAEKLDAHEDPPLQDYRPGGKINGGRGTDAWVFWYAQLVRMCGNMDRVGSDQDHETADAAVLDALRNEPTSVELLARDPRTGGPRTLTIHPKGLGPLMVCHALDWRLGWLGTKLQAIKNSDRAEHLELIDRAVQEMMRYYALLAWIVSHPGPGLPYQVGRNEDAIAVAPKIPHKYTELDPLDLPRIAQAFSVVNAQRLQALDALVKPQTGGLEAAAERPSWSVFIGSLSLRMNIPAHQLMYDSALGELLATIRTHNHAEAEAHAAAERKAQQDAAARRTS